MPLPDSGGKELGGARQRFGYGVRVDERDHLRREGGEVLADPRPGLGGEDVLGPAAGEEIEVGLVPATTSEEGAVRRPVERLGVDERAVEVEQQRGRGHGVDGEQELLR